MKWISDKQMKRKITLRSVSPELLVPTSEFCPEVGLEVAEMGGIPVTAETGDRLSVMPDGDGIHIIYRRRNEWFRALTFLPQVLESGAGVTETGAYRMLCYLADCSRNAVPNPDAVKSLIRCLARMGYDSMMLYTEDTYTIPDYPHFGYRRGRYTDEELRELDDYADRYGIELIPCIQTLAHLATALRWEDFKGYCDTEDILLVGDERTYRFVESALRQCAACFRSRRINIGMDEASLIGCGEYLHQHGYHAPSDVMLSHLGRVVELCRKIGFHPMMWSDMFFRMAFGDQYYVREGTIPAEVIRQVPPEVELIYWDYYSLDRTLVDHMLDCHAQFTANRTLFAGGAWKWCGFGAHNRFSRAAAEVQLGACASHGIDSVILTAWGDDGAEASQFSMLATMLAYAEHCYAGRADDAWLDLRAKQCFGLPLEVLMAFDLPDSLPEILADSGRGPLNPSRYLFFNDPLERLADCHFVRETAPAAFAANAERLLALSDTAYIGYALRTLGLLCRALAKKCDLGWRMSEAYLSGDRDTLRRIAEQDIPEILNDVEAFLTAYRAQWYRENKVYGFSTQEIRIGGLEKRLESARIRLLSYLNGETACIPEFDEPVLPVRQKYAGRYMNIGLWRLMASPGVL